MTVGRELRALAKSWEKFDLSLRMDRGLDREALVFLKRSLEECAEAWAGSEWIPRLGANILVDIVPATESNSYRYEGDIKEQILEVIYELQELVWNCVQIDEHEI